MPLWVKPVFWGTIVLVGVMHAVVKSNHDKIDRFVMGIVRDVGRFKAKKRRFANQKGLMISTLLRQDDPLQDLLLDDEKDKDDMLNTYTVDELLEFGDGLDGRPILLALFGRVYDVSAGAKFYGPGGAYGHFAGNDITYSLSTGCRAESCVGRSAEDLTEKELDEGKRWLSFFHLHDKYPLVGKLETDAFQILLDDLLEKEQGGEGQQLPPFLTH